LNKDIRDHQWG